MPRKEKSNRQLYGVTADASKDFYNFLARVGTIRTIDDVILKNQTPKNAQYSYPWGLYEELLDLDPHLAGVVDVRKVGVTSLPTIIQPADDSERAGMIASWVEWWLGEIGRHEYFIEGGFFQDRLNLLDAIPFGVSVLEIQWDDANGWLIPRRLLQRHNRQFRFTWDNELRLVSSPADYEGAALPEMKFLVFTPYTRWENPYGIPALRRVYFYSVFKRTGFRFWAVYLDKFGSPTIQGKYPKNASDTEKDDVYSIISAYQQETGVLIPEDFAIELIEARRGGTGSYDGFIEACNREVSKGILGQNLTTEIRGGSYAAANIHQMIRRDILESDSRLEMQAWNRLIHWAVDLNFSEPRLYPKFFIRTEAASEMRTRLEVFRQMASLGYPLSKRQVFEDLHLNPPEDEADMFIAPTRGISISGIWGNPGEDEPGAQQPELTEPPLP